MRRLKFKPNLGASRGAGGGSGACVGGGRVRGVVGRVQQGGRQSGDESTGGESTSEVETGEEQKAKWLPVSRPFEGSQSWELLGDVSYQCYNVYCVLSVLYCVTPEVLGCLPGLIPKPQAYCVVSFPDHPLCVTPVYMFMYGCED